MYINTQHGTVVFAILIGLLAVLGGRERGAYYVMSLTRRLHMRQKAHHTTHPPPALRRVAIAAFSHPCSRASAARADADARETDTARVLLLLPATSYYIPHIVVVAVPCYKFATGRHHHHRAHTRERERFMNLLAGLYYIILPWKKKTLILYIADVYIIGFDDEPRGAICCCWGERSQNIGGKSIFVSTSGFLYIRYARPDVYIIPLQTHGFFFKWIFHWWELMTLC